MTTRERFDTKWTKNGTTGCHEWAATTDRDGYGPFYWNGPGASSYRSFSFMASRSRSTSRIGGRPKSRLYSRLKCEASL